MVTQKKYNLLLGENVHLQNKSAEKTEINSSAKSLFSFPVVNKF